MSKLMIDVLRKAMEKVAVEDEADFQQLVGAEVVVSKLSAQVLPRTAHLLGKPGDAPLLARKLRLDEVAGMWCFVHNKGVNPFSFRLCLPEGSGKPL